MLASTRLSALPLDAAVPGAPLTTKHPSLKILMAALQVIVSKATDKVQPYLGVADLLVAIARVSRHLEPLSAFVPFPAKERVPKYLRQHYPLPTTEIRELR